MCARAFYRYIAAHIITSSIHISFDRTLIFTTVINVADKRIIQNYRHINAAELFSFAVYIFRISLLLSVFNNKQGKYAWLYIKREIESQRIKYRRTMCRRRDFNCKASAHKNTDKSFRQLRTFW